jgi:cellulose synthase/poly-beta-1,6-N-acetylglucosamine synthase-like glycosyltransferase
MPALEREMFLGRRCVAGDDGRLTWLVLASGHRTVHQASAQADSMFPDSWQAFAQQRVRWSRNSYRCYLTAMAQGWLWRQPLITQITVLQVLLTPVTMGAAVLYLVNGSLLGWQILLLALTWAVVGRAIRGYSHLREHPREIVLVPLVALVVAIVALPVKLWAAITMNRHGWLTRVDGDRVHGQSEIQQSIETAEHHA